MDIDIIHWIESCDYMFEGAEQARTITFGKFLGSDAYRVFWVVTSYCMWW